MKNKLSGFTLVELVIVIAIVIILSVVSVPIYRSYTKQAKMSEGYALLGTIFSSQKAYYSQYGNFLDDTKSSMHGANWTCNEEVLGIDARGNKYFTSFFFALRADQPHHFDAYVTAPDEAGGKIRLYFNIEETGGATYYN